MITTGLTYLSRDIKEVNVPKNNANVPPNINPVPIHSFRVFVFAGRYIPMKIATKDKIAEI